MENKDKKRDPMPPPNATPEEIGEFWDTHSLADYWEETHEVEFQVNLKSQENWQKLKDLIQPIKPPEFEKLAATLLESFLESPFVVARSGAQPSGDARSRKGEVSIQAKKYTGKNSPNIKTVEGDIRQAIRTLPRLQVYVLVISRDTAQLRDTLDTVEEDTGLDIVILELTDDLSDLGALCVTFWEDIRGFFESSGTCQNQEFLAWIEEKRDDSETKKKIEELRRKLEDGIQTQSRVQKDVEEYLIKRFNTDEGFNPINLSQTIKRAPLELEISAWWKNRVHPVCYLEGEEGAGKTWLAAKFVNSICENENIVTFWLDSKDWKGAKNILDLLDTCFRLIYPSYEQGKIPKLQNKAAKIWRKTLIVLDGVNERNAIKAAKQILGEYFGHENGWGDRICFLLTTRPLDGYQDFESNLWSGCHKIPVEPFNETELREALIQKELQPDDLPNSLKDIARIPRYFETCIRLRHRFGSFDAVTKELVLWEDLLYKIKCTNPQVRKKFNWQSVEDPQEILAELARKAKWTNVDDAPQASVELLKECFPNYHEIRRDLEEQRIALKAGKMEVELSEDHIVLGWALCLSQIKDFAEDIQNALEPIPSEDLRTEALFVALQITAISPNLNISPDQLSQKRAALMLAWFNSHNAQVTDERLSFWAKEDTDAYAQVVEFEFEHPNSPNYEEALIEPLAKIWVNKKDDLNRLASRLIKWILPAHGSSAPEEIVYIEREGHQFPMRKCDIQLQLLDAALSILSQRPERQFLKTLARRYAILQSNAKSDVDLSRLAQLSKKIGKLMRWGYTESILGDLHWLAEQAHPDELLLKGVYGLAACLRVNLPSRLERPLSEEDKKRHAVAEQRNRTFRPFRDRIRNQEQLLTGESPADNIKGNYDGLDYLAVRADLPGLTEHDKVEIKKLLHHISMKAELDQSASATLEDFCIENLMPWVAKYDPESYAELACNLKLNTLNQKWAKFKLSSIHGLIFKREDCERITEAILGMKQRLIQDVQSDNSSEAILLTALLTETLLFTAPEEKLTDWLEFLSSHELLRRSIFYEPLPRLLETLLPESIVELAQQKLKNPRLSLLDNQFPRDIESEKITEEDFYFWWWIYLCIFYNDENIRTWALENLKRRKSEIHPITFYSLKKASLDSNRFLSEILTDEKVRRHLFLKDGWFFITPIYEGENSYSYEHLVSVLPQEIVGSFLCSPKRRADLSRWGKELMARMCSILRGAKVDVDYGAEMRFLVNPEVLQMWAEQDKSDFLQLANKYLIRLFKSPQYSQRLSRFTDDILCLLLRFQPDEAMKYYRQWNAENFRTVYRTHYGVQTFLAQLWRVEDCNLSEHRCFRRKLLEECLNDGEIMFMTLAALAGGGEEELWNLVTQEYLVSSYAKERNLGVSILPWFGTREAIDLLEQLKSKDPSQWVCAHATWAYEVAQQERSCREVYSGALQTRDLFRISAVFEEIKPALSPTARWWHHEIEKDERCAELQDSNPKLFALIYRFWYRWGNSIKTKRNIEVFQRKLREYCRGEKLPSIQVPRIAPWWKPASGHGKR